MRAVAASVMGGGYVFVPFFLETADWLSFLLHLSVAVLMVFVAAGWNGKKDFLKFFGSFFAIQFLVGGAVSGVQNLFGHSISAPSAQGLAGAFCISLAAAAGYALLFRKRTGAKSVLTKIHCLEKCLTLSLLIDSGNLMVEPFSALPVILVSHSALPPPLDNPDPMHYPLPLRAIPFRTASGNGILFGFLPDKIQLASGGNKKRSVEAYVAVDTSNTDFSGFDGLMPQCLL